MDKLYVKKLIKKEMLEVFDISMPSEHNFVLDNGVVAHNCSHSSGYFLITYAGLYLRHNYPLEWWAAILTNAKEKEISGKLWPHVRDLVAPPDINLSTDQMEIDYANHKIRAKLGIIRGLGAATIDPIVAGRPYKDIQDFVNREVAGPALSRKLTHVGVLDSLYPPNLSLLDKLQLFENALETRKYNLKIEKAKKEGKTVKAQEPKLGEIPEEYKNIEKDPIKNAAIKKSILPSLLVGLRDLGSNYSKCLENRDVPSKMMVSYMGREKMALDSRYRPAEHEKIFLISGEMLQQLDDQTAEEVPEDKYAAVTAFIVDTKIFDYKKNTKQALKVVMDVDGTVSEKVLWPDYFTQKLEYPKELKKGCIATIFLKKRADKGDPCSIQEIVVET